MTNDAELSIGIEDNLTPVLQKMAAQTRAFGDQIGAEANQIDKAVKKISGAMANLGSAGNGSGIGTQAYSKSIQLATQNLNKYRAEMERLSHVERAKTNSAGRQYDPSTGRLVSAKDVDAYNKAADGLKRYTAEVERLTGLQNQANSGGAKFTEGIGVRAADFDKYRQQAEGLSRSTKDLEKMYSGMFGSVEAINGKSTNWWPPEMFRGAEQFTKKISELPNSVRYAMYDVSNSLTIGGVAMAALGVGAIMAAAKFERAFADVRRTVQGSGATLEGLRQGLIGMSQDIPVAFADLTKIASVGGQMGINAEGILQFTETIAKLTATTNLTSDAASTALGRFKAFFAEADDSSLAVTDATFSNLASSILKVGVNSVATESGIVNVSTQISSMGSYAGFTADQVIGLSGALSSVGVPPELSRGVITRLFNNIGEAVSEGGVKLQDFANLAGVSSEDFARAWGTDQFAYVFTDLIAGLGELQSGTGDAVGALHDLGVTSVRDVPVLLRLASAAGEAGKNGGLLAQTMNDARTGWRQNIELQLQYSKISETLSERLAVLVQNFEAFFATMGASSVGPMKDIVNAMIDFMKGLTAFTATPAGQTISLIAVGVAVLGGAVLLATAGLARFTAMAMGAAQAATALGISTTAATNAVRILGLSLGVIGVVGAIIGAVAAIGAIGSAADSANNPVQDLNGALEAMKKDTLDGSSFTKFDTAAKGAATSAGEARDQAKLMGDLMGYAGDKAYGASEGVEKLGDSAMQTSLNFGKASREFLKSSILTSDPFKNAVTKYGPQFDDLVDKGFNMDRLIEKVAKGGRAAGEAYLKELTGTGAVGNDLFGRIQANGLDLAGVDTDVARANNEILNLAESGVGAFKNTATGARLMTTEMRSFSNATQMSTEAVDEFQTQNQEAIDKIASGYQKFVDSGTLVGLTQKMKEIFAQAESDELTPEMKAQQWETAWSDAYGGASFSLQEYMGVFRRASEEQAVFTQGLQTLLARGVDPAIISDLAAMGPQASKLVQALVSSTDEELQAYKDLYAQTGFDSMVGLAAGQLAAQQIVLNAAKTLSGAQLQQLSADLAAGTPLAKAMEKWQLDASGNPIKVPSEIVKPYVPGVLAEMQQGFNKGLSLPVRPYLTVDSITATNGSGSSSATNLSMRHSSYASGGYTGPGGKYQPAGLVHRDEFVFTKEATRSLGTPFLYSLMNSAQSGRPATPSGGGGYAAGGLVSAGFGNGVVQLSVADRGLLQTIADRVGLTITERAIAGAANSGNLNSTNRRVS